MFDDIHMIPRAFGYTMSKSFYKYLENKDKDLSNKDDKSLKKEKTNEKNNKSKYINLGYTKTF